MVVYKYRLPQMGQPSIEMPRGAKILKVECQGGIPFVWALVDEKAPIDGYLFHIFGTGHSIDKNVIGEHIATFQEGSFVWHLFHHRGR